MKTIDILLIEDNLGDIFLLEEAFEEVEMANSIESIRNGEEALKYLFKEPPYENTITPDLILLDINLPRKNGHEILVKIKEDPRLKKIPVIMLSTSTNHDDVMKAYKNMANCFISKPLEIEEFAEKVNEIKKFWFTQVALPPK